jgi:transcriptional regulator GlxA family with amidase domain
VLGRSDRIVAAGGHAICTEPADGAVDVLVVPGFEVASPGHIAGVVEKLEPEVRRVRKTHARGVQLASVCVGAFVLGASGVLDHRTATTAWLFAPELQARHPACTVDADAMIVSDEGVTTTAAFSAVQDLALRFVRLASGDDLARRLARLALVADNRASQSPYVDETMLERAGDGLVRDAKAWLVEHLDQPYDLAALATAFHVSGRTMLRRFAQDAGCTPLDYLQSVRIRAAKRLLEAPDHTVASAMRSVGYTDPTSFRRLFQRHTGMSPGAYKAAFGQAIPSHSSGWH